MLVRKTILRGASLVSGTDSRWALASVQVERRGKDISVRSTNGHMALLVRTADQTPDTAHAFDRMIVDCEPVDQQILLPANACKSLRTVTPKWPEGTPSVTAKTRLGECLAIEEPTANGTVKLADVSERLGPSVSVREIPTVEGRFPSVDSVVPPEPDSNTIVVRIEVDAERLATLLDAIRLAVPVPKNAETVVDRVQLEVRLHADDREEMATRASCHPLVLRRAYAENGATGVLMPIVPD